MKAKHFCLHLLGCAVAETFNFPCDDLIKKLLLKPQYFSEVQLEAVQHLSHGI